MNEHRPKLHIKPQRVDRWLEVAGWVVLLGTWLLVILSYSGLPDQIPAMYDFRGNITNWGSKIRIVYLPGISTILLLFITYLNLHPQVLNYPVNIDEHNAFKNYFVAIRFNRYVKLLLALIFFVIALRTIEMAHGHSAKIIFWSVPIIVIMFIFPLATLIIYLFKKDLTEKEE